MTATLCAIEIDAHSSVALTRIEKMGGYRAVDLLVVEGYPAEEFRGEVLQAAERTSAVVSFSVGRAADLRRLGEAMIEAATALTKGEGNG